MTNPSKSTEELLNAMTELVSRVQQNLATTNMKTLSKAVGQTIKGVEHLHPYTGVLEITFESGEKIQVWGGA
jgi:hypothetical protein